MRFFLGFLLLDMIFHSLFALTPYRDWIKELGMERFPKRLPTAKEIQELADEASEENPNPVTDRVMETMDSVWLYFQPWPQKKTREKIRSWEDVGKYVIAWPVSRLDLFETIVGIDQRWSMFSPNTSKRTVLARSRLVYGDGSTKDIRLLADPPDLTKYSHWFEEKILDYELRIDNDVDSRFGYCNFLKHKYKTNIGGSPLQTIYIYKIEYRYPHPDEDAYEVLKSQNGPPSWDKIGPIFEYDVSKNQLWTLDDEEREEAQAYLESLTQKKNFRQR